MATPALRTAPGERDALLHLVVTSICIAVERSALTDGRHVGEATGAPVSDRAATAPQPTLEALVRIYNNAMWTQPVEHELQVLSDWSLAKAHSKALAFERDISYPVLAPAGEGTEDDSSVIAALAQQHTRRPIPPAATPALFQLSKIVEDALEARWDHRGNPVPLRRNVLGEAYAPQSEPLQFLKQRPVVSATQIYQRVKHTMRSEAIDREKRRIQALNDRERQRKEQLLAAALSPEDALEAKLDRLLHARDSLDNNDTDAVAGDTERRRAKDGGAEEAEDDNNQRQQLAA